MIFGEYSYEDDIRVQRQEAFEDGMEKGISQQKTEAALKLLTDDFALETRKTNGLARN